jgi:ribosome recycling factor
VDYYGSATPLRRYQKTSVPDARTITLQPEKKNMFHVNRKRIMIANMKLNPTNNGGDLIIT